VPRKEWTSAVRTAPVRRSCTRVAQGLLSLWPHEEQSMAKAVLTISSKNYGAWALRGWLMCRLAKLDFDEHVISPDDPAMKAEMLLLSASMRVPSLDHDGIHVWYTLAIG
jgi:hypothetical protein